MTSVAVWLAMLAATADPADAVVHPSVLDPRLKIELVAAEPEIVTPTGIAVDAAGRVLVVESHTHFRPPGYEGPPADRIRVFEDRDGDGRAECTGNFFEGTKHTMNVGVHPDGSVYVATRGEIFRLRDTDGDGRADERTQIARLETAGDYPHNGLSGFAFDFAGNVYFGLGENLGRSFRLIGTDGSMASDLEGGQVYRCRADGSKMEMIAFGFWNPFHVALDAFGRLFAVDNDPDSLPPCRLMHIVEGGNYGYRYRNGRKGVHPFTAWNGELPGTLPMVSGTGEAPSGIVAYESDQFPDDYRGDLLLTSWGDHRIERHRLEPRGASFRSTPTAIVKGDENFRPVGIALAPDGSLYISDWVLKSYDVHGKGRVWRISAAQPPSVRRPTDPAAAIHAAHGALRESAARKLAADASGRQLLTRLANGDESPRVRTVAIAALCNAGEVEPVRKAAAADAHPGVRAMAIRLLPDGRGCDERLSDEVPKEVRAEALRRATSAASVARMWQLVSDADAFTAEAARVGLARTGTVTADLGTSGMPPAQRLAALLVLRESRNSQAHRVLGKFLADPDSAVRFAAIQWVGEDRLTEFRRPLEQALSAGPATSRLFGGYLAALERLDGVVREPSDEWALDEYIVRALNDSSTSSDVRRWSLRMLRPDNPALTMDRLNQFIDAGDADLQLEAVRTLRDCTHAERAERLAKIAAGDKYPTRLRAEAIVGLTPENASVRALLVRLSQGEQQPAVRHEALRSLVGAELTAEERRVLEQLHTDALTGSLVARVLKSQTAGKRPAPDDLAGWMQILDDRLLGDPATGERVFFHHAAAGCARCHQMFGRGARIGPELTATGARLSRERLVESIVRPGKEIAPHFASWLVVTTEGKMLTGMLVKEEATGEQTYADTQGVQVRLAPSQIESRKPLSTSIMPDGLGERLTLEEIRDLLAYLTSSAEGTP